MKQTTTSELERRCMQASDPCAANNHLRTEADNQGNPTACFETNQIALASDRMCCGMMVQACSASFAEAVACDFCPEP